MKWTTRSLWWREPLLRGLDRLHRWYIRRYCPLSKYGYGPNNSITGGGTPLPNAPDQARALPSPEDGCSTPLHGIGRCTMHPSPFYCGSRTDDGRCGAAPFHDREACEHLSNTGDKAMLNKQQISELKIRECEGQWVAGWWDDRFSPSSASGDMGFYADTPEDAVKALLNYVLDNAESEVSE